MRDELLSVLVGPAIVFGLVGALVGYLIWRNRARPRPKIPAYMPVPSINPDLCIGCEKCVAVCPATVLGLDAQHKSYILPEEGRKDGKLDDCISCQKCAAVCPTQALIMYKGGLMGQGGTATQDVVVPELDEYYQSKQVPGLYLVGEAAGTPLVKNGVNLGRAVVEHMRKRGGLVPLSQRPLSPDRSDGIAVDVVIIGAGPAGLSAGLSCLQRGFSYVILESTDSPNSTVRRYPMTKKVEAMPEQVRCVGLLPVWNCTTPELNQEWNRIIVESGLHVSVNTMAEQIEFDESSRSFLVKTRDMKTNREGRSYRAQRVVTAIGGLGVPNKLGREGEDLPHVQDVLDDAGRYSSKVLLVIGGGDSAIESAVSLAEPQRQNRVLLSYRKKESDLRANPGNLSRFKQAVSEDRILPLFGADVVRFAPQKVILKVPQPGQEPRNKELDVDRVFVLIGGSQPKEWLKKNKIEYKPTGHASYQKPATDKLVEKLIGPQVENNAPGRPVPVASPPSLSGTMNQTATSLQTLFDNQSQEMARIAAQHAARLDPNVTAGLIKEPKDYQRIVLPKRLRIEGPTQTIRQVLAQAQKKR